MMVEINGQRLWADLSQHYWEATMILLVGGLIGVLFIIVLRRPLCVESDLPFPESVASAEIVKAGEAGSHAPKYVFGAMGFAGLIQILKSDKGLQIFREYVEGFLPFPRSVVHHFNFSKQPSVMSRITAASGGPRRIFRRRSWESAISSVHNWRPSTRPAVWSHGGY